MFSATEIGAAPELDYDFDLMTPGETLLRVTLLGGFDCRSASGEPVAFPTLKVRALFAFLAATAGQGHARERLAGLLWDDKADARARANLRKTLSRLRSALAEAGAEGLIADSKLIGLRADSVEVDALSLAGLAAEGGPEDLARAASLYGGDFLEAFPDCGESFEAWLMTERRRLEEEARGVLGQLLDHCVVTGSMDRAIQAALKLLALDPLQESVHRTLMRLYLYQDRVGSALRQYELCRDLLARELGIEPGAETENLRADLRQKLPPGPGNDSARDIPESDGPPGRSADGDTTGEDPVRSSLALPGRPSIAVLPFTNMSGDQDQDYFADGITEDILTGLCRLNWLMVIARHSTFRYKGQTIDVARVARELGVRYLLEGSVRKAGSRLRVTAQLVDGSGGGHVWAERYDRDLDDIFVVQDEITAAIVASIDTGVLSSERERARRKVPASLDAWDLYQRGMWYFYRYTSADSVAARRLFRDAIARSPEFSPPHAGLALCGYADVTFGECARPRDLLAEAIEAGETAVSLDEGDAFGHFALGRVYTLFGKLDLAIAHLEKAVALNPSFGYAHYGLGFAFYWVGEAAETLTNVDRAIRLSPRDPMLWAFYMLKAFSHYQLEDYGEAEATARNAIRERAQEFWNHLGLAMALVRQQRMAEARAAIAEARRVKPNLSVSLVVESLPYMHADYMQRYREDLAAAGLPL